MRRSVFMGSASVALAAASLGVSLTPTERRLGRLLRAPEGHGGTGTGAGDPPAPREPEAIAAALSKQVDEATGAVKQIAEKAAADAKQGLEMGTETKEAADKALAELGGVKSQLTEFGQTIDRLKSAGLAPDQVKSLGELFVESDSFKKLAEDETQGQRGRATLDVKGAMPDLETKATITLATTNAAGSAGASVFPTVLPGILQIPQRRLTIRDLISVGRMSGNALQYVRQTGFTNNAGMVAEGARKPQSDLKLALVDTTAKVIAHFMKASRQVLDDSAQLRSLIDGHLLYGLAFREEAQILYGDGTGQNLLGIVPQASDYSIGAETQLIASRDPDGAGAGVGKATVIDRIRLAMLQAVLAEFPATGIVLNPLDWALIELQQDTMGRYIIGQPQGDAQPRLWRTPVVETPAITAGNFLTGAFKLGAQLFDRWSARVQLATENEDDFVNNLVTILAEQRLALAVYRPEAFIYGPVTGTAGTAP